LQGGKNMKPNIVEQIRQANKLLYEYVSIAVSIAQQITDVVKKATGIELTWSLGWEEAGLETICFELEDAELKRRKNEELKALKNKGESGYVSFTDVLYEVFEGMRKSFLQFDCPFGVPLTIEEAEKIRKALKKLIKSI